MATATRRVTTINPATGEDLEEFELFGPDRVEAALTTASAAFADWRGRSVDERAALLRRAASVLRQQQARWAGSITREMGKPVTEAEAEVEKCAVTCEYYADHAGGFLADEPAPSDSSRSFVHYRPLGIVLAIMPWNFPLWQVFRFAAPALMAGNVGVLKHASITTRCALDIEEVFRLAGLPEGAFTTLVIDTSTVPLLLKDPRVRAVTLTGSDATGSAVAAQAGSALKKTVLELGGSDAFIVLEDADIDAAAATAVRSRFQNCGQSCIAAKRFIVVDTVADAFEERMVAHTRALVLGDPLDRATTLGPLARSDLRDTLREQLQGSLRDGASLLTGGHAADRAGWYFEPTVITGCDAGTTAFREETFGPLAAIGRVADEAAAIELANHSDFGLGGNVWTADAERGIAVARQLDTGGVFVNGMTHSDPRLPFGGVKRSGYGRELWSVGLREFMNLQTIWVAEEGSSAPSSPGGSVE